MYINNEGKTAKIIRFQINCKTENDSAKQVNMMRIISNKLYE